jgi:hypothetical protein
MSNAYKKEIIFDKAPLSVSRVNANALFLSLAAAGILEIQNTSEGMKWFIGQEAPRTVAPNLDVSFLNATIGEAKYKVNNYWTGLHLHPATRICVCTPAILISELFQS